MVSKVLLETTKALQTGSFNLSAGGQSDYYFDSRRFLCNQQALVYVSKIFAEDLYYHTDANAICGIAHGATPLIASILTVIQLSPQYVHTTMNGFLFGAEKKHGIVSSITGVTYVREPVAIFEDVVTTGKSVLGAIDYLEDIMAVKIAKVYCLFDRNEGGREKLLERGYPLASIYSIEDGEIVVKERL